ncbi:MAG: methenyltetrahydromethanopterin cyclohydrolase [Candidatus Thorarchaeota archaeon]
MYNNISLAKESMKHLEDLIENAPKYQVEITTVNHATIIDCGIEVPGSIAAGMLFTKICLGGLAKVNLDFPEKQDSMPFLTMRVESSFPVLAALGCQAASWNIKVDDFFGMACGPGRALAQKPSKIYKLLEYKDESEKAIICMESDKLPSDEVIEYLADKCNIDKNNLFILMIKTNCLVEYMQMAARSIELGIFKLVEQLNFSKEKILHAIGTGIIPPLSDDIEESNDRVNNGLIYGTKLYLIIKSDSNDNMDELIKKLPSNSSKSYGRKFLELFKEAGQDFANFDLSLLAPSVVIINDLRTGKIYHEGKVNLGKILE